MADITDTAIDLPAVLYKQDFAKLLRCSDRSFERMRRYRKIPDPLPITGRPRWSRDVVLRWLSGGRAR